jgi:hypothetical protein
LSNTLGIDLLSNKLFGSVNSFIKPGLGCLIKLLTPINPDDMINSLGQIIGVLNGFPEFVILLLLWQGMICQHYPVNEDQYVNAFGSHAHRV